MFIILAVLILDLLVPFIIAIPYEGYSHKKTVMSILGCKENPWSKYYNIWFVLSGSGFVYLGYYLYQIYKDTYNSFAIALFILVAIYGIGDLIISGFFPLNENREDVTIVTKIHGIGSAVGFTTMQFAPLILAIIQFKENQTALGISSVVFFVLSLISFVFFVMGEKPKFEDTFLGYTGLWQRVLCMFFYLPFVVWIINLI